MPRLPVMEKRGLRRFSAKGPWRRTSCSSASQPGDREDRVGRPFVGPAGLIFDRALSEAGVDRKRAYVTNAVKHFKFEPRGKLRLHKRPNANEIKVCRRWLFGEIEVMKAKFCRRAWRNRRPESRSTSGGDRQKPRRYARAGERVADVRDGASVLASARA